MYINWKERFCGFNKISFYLFDVVCLVAFNLLHFTLLLTSHLFSFDQITNNSKSSIQICWPVFCWNLKTKYWDSQRDSSSVFENPFCVQDSICKLNSKCFYQIWAKCMTTEKCSSFLQSIIDFSLHQKCLFFKDLLTFRVNISSIWCVSRVCE